MNTEKPILVTGGTGTLGRLVVKRLRAAGREVRVLSRGGAENVDGVQFVIGDLETGDGIEAAVAGVETIVHCAGSQKGDEEKARTLVSAAAEAGVRHLVYISVVGADRVPMQSALDRAMFGYFASKLGAEDVIERSGIPFTILRASQFHDLILGTVKGMSRLPVVPVPSRLRFQPVEADEVAAKLVELALGEPAGLVPDIAGPRVYGLDELTRSYVHASGHHRALIPLRLPGAAARAFRDGANLAPHRAVGTRTWEEFLAEHVG